uniref:Uncharacterized protein n=1 Tax=Plectus sambesii TaxID=2011161 RepID=A0A914VDL3_9BILA
MTPGSVVAVGLTLDAPAQTAPFVRQRAAQQADTGGPRHRLTGQSSSPSTAEAAANATVQPPLSILHPSDYATGPLAARARSARPPKTKTTTGPYQQARAGSAGSPQYGHD